MLRVIGKTIELTRGDTARIQIAIKGKDGRPYASQDGDALEFTVRRHADAASETLLHKTIGPDGVLVLAGADTSGLEYGTYVYDIQLTLLNGDINTIIVPNKFILCEEVTM